MATTAGLNSEAKPEMSKGLAYFYVRGLLFGILLTIVFSLFLSATTPVPAYPIVSPQTSSGKGSAFAKSVENKLLSVPPSAPLGRRLYTLTFDILRAFSLTLITVSLYEILKYVALLYRYRKDEGQAFDDFFGVDAVRYSHKGKIILQASRIQELSAPRNTAAKQAELRSDAPALKARNQTNRWDVEGVKLLRNFFNDRGIKTPDLSIVDKDDKQVLGSPNEPFIITLGMGFIHQLALEKFLDWFKIEDSSPWGDCLLLRTEYVPPKLGKLQPRDKDREKTANRRVKVTDDNRLTGAADPSLSEGGSVASNSIDGFCTEKHPFEPADSPGFLRILPLDWDLYKWLDNPAECQDYAIIYRHTHLVGSKTSPCPKVQLVIAGFTERSTAIGAKYVAERWPALYAKYVRDYLLSPGQGDFLSIVGGLSSLESFEKWDELLSVMPKDVLGKGKWDHLDPNDEPFVRTDHSTQRSTRTGFRSRARRLFSRLRWFRS